MTFVSHVECTVCGRRHDASRLLTVCEVAAEPLTPEMFTDLHRVMTRRTLEHGEAGRLRQPHEDALVYTLRGEPLFDPPIADELPERLPALCAFANGERPRSYIASMESRAKI